jgi:hypothetical protein
MSRRVQHLLAALKQVKRLSSNDKKKFLKSCNKDFIHGLCECIRNMINGRVPLKPCQLKCLSRHKQTLRKLALKKTSIIQRKKLLQKGGFLQYLLDPLISGLGSLLANVLKPSNAAR